MYFLIYTARSIEIVPRGGPLIFRLMMKFRGGPPFWGCMLMNYKGQLISKCPDEKSVSSKIPTKIFLRLLPWKFTTSRLTQKEYVLFARR